MLNAVIGFFQEFRAEKAVASLARLAAPKARVVRNGRAQVCAAAEIVAGDILLLDAGDLVAADARLIEASSLRANEVSLTGESQPVDKSIGILPIETPLADHSNMVFLGTRIAGGSARALVIAAGMGTELGLSAQLLETAEKDATPLQKRLDRITRYLLGACLGTVALVFLLGLLRSAVLFELFLSFRGQPSRGCDSRRHAGRRDGGPGAGNAAHDSPQRFGAPYARRPAVLRGDG